MNVSEHWQRELTEEQARKIAELAALCMVRSTRTVDDRVRQILDSGFDVESEAYRTKRWVIWDRGNPVAHAKTFVRQIEIGPHEIAILALATVCSAPGQRGRGFGRKVVESAFRQVDRGEAEYSLFQTGVPDFYQKLHCFSVTNNFFWDYGGQRQSPFFEDQIMVYAGAPGLAKNWPKGDVNLKGPGF